MGQPTLPTRQTARRKKNADETRRDLNGTTNAAGKVVGGTKVERERNAFLLLYDRIEDDDVAGLNDASDAIDSAFGMACDL